jgi:hypothetical protein
VDPSLALFVFGSICGAFGGYHLGVWSSEFRRGKHEAERAWNNRSSYRK